MNCPNCQSEMLKREISGFGDWQYECVTCRIAILPRSKEWVNVDDLGEYNGSYGPA